MHRSHGERELRVADDGVEQMARHSGRELSAGRPVQRARAAAVLGALALLAGGCTPAAEPLPSEDAVAHYDTVVGALTTQFPDQDWTLDTRQRTVGEEDGRCLYSPGVWEAERPLDAVSGEDGWGEVADRLDPVLAEHGFEELGSPSRSGALYSVSSRDRHGVELELDAQGRLSLRGALVEAESCTAEALGL